MTMQNKKRAPILLGPNWQGASRARESAPQKQSCTAPSFHASLRECGHNPEERPESVTQNSAAIEPRDRQPQQLHLTLLKRIGAWLSAKNANAANRQMQIAPHAALDTDALRLSPASSPQSSVLKSLFAWLQAKYASSATKRLRVAEMVPLGEKRFLAVVCVEGREFLVGGGASGVSVVTQLDAARNSAHAPRSEFEFQGAIE
jgi:hypothetical protein